MGRVSALVLATMVGTFSCGESASTNDDGSDDGNGATDRRPNSTSDDGGDATNDGDDDATTQPKTPPLAAGLAIDEVALYQVLKIDLVANGKAAKPSLPIIAGREALFRVFVRPTDTWKPRSVTARLTLTTKGQETTFESKRTPAATSTDGALDSTFSFDVPAESIDASTTWKVGLFDLAKGAEEGDATAKWPRDDEEVAALGAKSVERLKLRVVPIKTSNNLMADLGANALQSYREYLRRMYPISDIDVAIAPAYTYSGTIPKANGDGWSAMLNNLTSKHKSDRAPDDTYYIGVFRPSASFTEFCRQGSCVSGLGYMLEDQYVHDVPEYKTSIIVGFTSADAHVVQDSLPHEVGHNHGRKHAPCENRASDLDPNFPDKSGGIGTWGYDATNAVFFDPKASKTPPRDVMSYCSPYWVSGYTYAHLYDRVVAIGSWKSTTSSASPVRYREMQVRPDGSVAMGSVVERRPIHALDEDVEIVDDRGRTRTEKGIFIPYDHLPGGALLVPESAEATYVHGRLLRPLPSVEELRAH